MLKNVKMLNIKHFQGKCYFLKLCKKDNISQYREISWQN